MYDVAIIGCGVSGASVAMELSRYKLKAVILEKENDVCDETSKANSAIVHAGYDPCECTLMAKLNVDGCAAMPELCARLDVPYKQIGSLVLAFTDEEVEHLYHLRRRGIANGVERQQILSYREVKAIEPNISDEVKGALYAPTAGIVDPWQLGIAMAETAVKNGTEILLESEVDSINKNDSCWKITLKSRKVLKARYVINAAGVHSDKVHNMAAPPDFKINPCKGEYYLLDKAEGRRVNHVIFQCPNEKGKGVLIAPTVNGNLIVGPTGESINNTRDTSTSTAGLEYVKNAALKSVPGVNFRENIRNFSGIRANSSENDFIIRESEPGFIDVAGMRSPGLASSPAIGPYVAKLLKNAGLRLKKKDNWDGRRKVIRLSELEQSEKDMLIKKEPAYGRVVCRCETITEGEILAALNSPIPPCSIEGIKRRTNAGMGRCQGGFCSPRVLDLIAEAKNIKPEEVLMDKNNSFVLTGETKGGEANV